MPLLILAVVIGLPILELYVIIRVGEAIGPLWTVLALTCTSLIGVRLVRSQGRAVLRDFSAAIAAGRPPAREALDGALVFVGGALLIVPGFVTDGLGLLLLFPPTRVVARRSAKRRFRNRVAYLGGLQRGGRLE
ncbi:MAG TPA: FxsA family protein, partial [Solirubrobacteraceae bacterium]|nr:FxsA family protein [Solirubrobacteraceae bacterium]